MKLTFSEWQKVLPDNTIVVGPNGVVSFNFQRLTGNRLDLSSSVVESIVKLLGTLSTLTDKINEGKTDKVDFVKTNIVGTSSEPQYLITCKVNVDTSNFINNLIDPTAND